MALPKFPNAYDLLKLSQNEISSLNKEELYKYTNILNKEVNRRLEKLKTSGAYESSNAYYQAGKHGDFVIRNKNDRNKMLGDFQAAYNFLHNKTSTLTGIKDIERKSRQRMSDITGISPNKITHTVLKEFWNIFNKMQESNAYTTAYMRIGGTNELLERTMNDYFKYKKSNLDEQTIEKTLITSLKNIAEGEF